MNLRAFNEPGVQAARDFLDVLRDGAERDVPMDLLLDDDLSEDQTHVLPKVPNEFGSRFELALWLDRSLDSVLDSTDIDRVGVWTWLTLLLLDIVAPRRTDGTRKIHETPRYVLEPDNWLRYYRHLLAGPYFILRSQGDNPHISRAILAGKPSVPGDLYEQIASRQEIVTSSALLALTYRLYWDSSAKRLKPGAGGKRAGSARRLASVLLQLDLTWDLAEMADDDLIALLPAREFSRYTKAT